MLRLIFCSLVLLAFTLTREARCQSAAAEPDTDGVKFFAEQVEPIFIAHCYQCHGNGKNKGGLNFYSRDAMLKGGDSGPGFDSENPSESLLLGAVNYSAFEMPPNGKLPPAKIAIIEKWLKLGAPMPERKDIVQTHHGVPEVNDQTKQHWSFQPVRRPAVPEQSSDWVKTPVDAFVLQQLTDAGFQPNPAADRRTLIRRVTFDLIGLPPTQAQIDAFIADTRTDAYERLVNSLLESPHYGEHWARYWLDLVRYAESNSFERDNPKPFVWKYRDYVINAFNNDKPYNTFVMEQLAGDELPQVTPETVIATGFYRLGSWDDEPADPQLARYDELDDIVTTVGQGFLGLTLNCARCHDHKLDPIPAADYYSFLAFFQNTQRYGIRSDESVLERSVRDIASPEEKRMFEDEINRHNAHVAELRSQLDTLESRLEPQLPGGERDDFKADSVRQNILKKYVGQHLTKAEFDEYVKQRKEWNHLKNHPPKSAARALCITESGRDAPSTFILIRGNPGAEGDKVDPGFPQVLSPPKPAINVQDNAATSRRRIELARWIVDPQNPLTARVMVNRLWQWHFDAGLVESANNFGLTTARPKYSELLDWLASEFVARGWSVKEMHRLILLSNTYQMSSSVNPVAYDKDPQNQLWWRVPMRRLRAEEIRDTVLFVNRTLKLDRMFGPSIYPQLPEAVLAGQSMPGHNWFTSSRDDSARRSIYIHVKRSVQVPLLASFDVADADFTCPVRFATTQPTQALGMINSEFMNEQATLFADDVRKCAGSELSAQVQLALTRATQRTPTAEEIQKGLALIASLQKDHGQSAETALKSFCLIALNMNETIYLD